MVENGVQMGLHGPEIEIFLHKMLPKLSFFSFFVLICNLFKGILMQFSVTLILSLKINSVNLLVVNKL